MDVFNIILTILSIICTVVTCIGARKTFLYYKKSKQLLTLTNIKAASIEAKKISNNMIDVLKYANPQYKAPKGVSVPNLLIEVGQSIKISLCEIKSNMPSIFVEKFNKILKTDEFNFETYIDSFILGNNVEEGLLKNDEYLRCSQQVISNIQEELKKYIEELEEGLK